MDSKTPTPSIHVAIAVVIGILMAIVLGQTAADANYTRAAMILAIGPLMFLVLGLQGRVWIIIPFLGSFGGSIPFLPGRFPVRDLAVLGTFAIFIFLATFKKLEPRARLGAIDFILLLNLLNLGTVYMRNPVGTLAMGTETVGGRPYVIIVIACMLYWIYSHVSIGPKLAYRLPLVILGGSSVSFAIWGITYLYPPSALAISKFYTGVEFSSLLAEFSGPSTDESASLERLSGLGNFGIDAMMCLIAYFKAITLISPLHFWRFVAFGMSAFAILMAGFRSKIFGMGMYFLAAAYVRGGMRDVIRAGLFGGIVLLFVIGMHFAGLYHLPGSVQRALSFIPISWDIDAVESAAASSEWRYEMWRDVLENDKWIRNKWLGDGFGFSRYELNIMLNAQIGGQSFLGGDTTEAQKIQGAYHSGPLSAIRYVGVIGFLLYMVLLVAAAYKAYHLIKITRGSPYQPMAMMFIPTIFSPIVYVFIFGGFDSDFALTIGSVAGLKMMTRSFNDYKASQARTSDPALTAAERPPLIEQVRARASST